MGKNSFTLSLGGEDVTLKFNIGTLRNIKKITGTDPLKMLQSGEYDVADLAESIVKAAGGLMDTDITEKFNQLPIPVMTDIITAFSESFSAGGETGKDTQSGEAA